MSLDEQGVIYSNGAPTWELPFMPDIRHGFSDWREAEDLEHLGCLADIARQGPGAKLRVRFVEPGVGSEPLVGIHHGWFLGIREVEEGQYALMTQPEGTFTISREFPLPTEEGTILVDGRNIAPQPIAIVDADSRRMLYLNESLASLIDLYNSKTPNA